VTSALLPERGVAARAGVPGSGDTGSRRSKVEGWCGVAEFGDVRFLTVAEVAAIMRVSKMTVYRLVHSGEMPAVRVGRSFRVPEQVVHDYLRHSYVDTA
jgi:excisionase family DNA binding protein